jgi:hypothetical protein
MQSDDRDATDLLRGAGGMLLAAGAVVLELRKSTNHDWGQLALLLVVAIPMLVLFALALGGNHDEERAAPSRSVLMVLAILLGPLALSQLLDLLGANTANTLYTALILALAGVFAGYGGQRARVSYAMLLAGLALLLAWLIVWSRILDHPSIDTIRILLVVAAALLFVAAVGMSRAKAIGATEIASVGGIAAVAAGTIGVVVGTFAGVLSPVERIVEKSHTSGRGVSIFTETSGFQHFGWDLYLLIVSVALVWTGARVRARGLGYVGGVGLFAFLVSVGSQVTRIESGDAPTSSLAGWPLVLLGLGALGLLAPALSRRDA